MYSQDISDDNSAGNKYTPLYSFFINNYIKTLTNIFLNDYDSVTSANPKNIVVSKATKDICALINGLSVYMILYDKFHGCNFIADLAQPSYNGCDWDGTWLKFVNQRNENSIKAILFLIKNTLHKRISHNGVSLWQKLGGRTDSKGDDPLMDVFINDMRCYLSDLFVIEDPRNKSSGENTARSVVREVEFVVSELHTCVYNGRYILNTYLNGKQNCSGVFNDVNCKQFIDIAESNDDFTLYLSICRKVAEFYDNHFNTCIKTQLSNNWFVTNGSSAFVNKTLFEDFGRFARIYSFCSEAEIDFEETMKIWEKTVSENDFLLAKYDPLFLGRLDQSPANLYSIVETISQFHQSWKSNVKGTSKGTSIAKLFSIINLLSTETQTQLSKEMIILALVLCDKDEKDLKRFFANFKSIRKHVESFNVRYDASEFIVLSILSTCYLKSEVVPEFTEKWFREFVTVWEDVTSFRPREKIEDLKVEFLIFTLEVIFDIYSKYLIEDETVDIIEVLKALRTNYEIAKQKVAFLSNREFVLDESSPGCAFFAKEHNEFLSDWCSKKFFDGICTKKDYCDYLELRFISRATLGRLYPERFEKIFPEDWFQDTDKRQTFKNFLEDDDLVEIAEEHYVTKDFWEKFFGEKIHLYVDLLSLSPKMYEKLYSKFETNVKKALSSVHELKETFPDELFISTSDKKSFLQMYYNIFFADFDLNKYSEYRRVKEYIDDL